MGFSKFEFRQIRSFHT